MAGDKIVGYKMVEYKNVGGEMSGIPTPHRAITSMANIIIVNSCQLRHMNMYSQMGNLGNL